MKIVRRSRVPMVAALVAVAVAVACASTPPDRVALNTLKGMKLTADTAMESLAVLYAEGRAPNGTGGWVITNPERVRISDAQKAEAIAAYDTFAATAKSAALSLVATDTPEMQQLVLRESSAALGSLVALLHAFGVKGF